MTLSLYKFTSAGVQGDSHSTRLRTKHYNYMNKNPGAVKKLQQEAMMLQPDLPICYETPTFKLLAGFLSKAGT